MMTSVNNYSRYLNAPQRWALGRFVLPVARLDEFLNAQENVAADPWQLSGIISANIEADLAAVDEFNRKALGAVIDTIEVRVRDMDEIDLVRKNQPPSTAVFFEFAPEQADEFLPILRQFGGCAKLRTGGVVEEAFPTVESVAGFIVRCAELGVPFKATAGLHHPLRCFHPLTYEPNRTRGNDARIPEPLYRGRNCLERGALRQAPRRASRLPLALPTESAQTGTSAMTR